MNKKLEQLTYDLNEFLYEKEPLFEEYPLVYCSTGLAVVIEVDSDSIVFASECDSWVDFLHELERRRKLYERLHILVNSFFQLMTNDGIEEKYGIGKENDGEEE